MNSTSDGLFVFILFIPLLWVLWLWVLTFTAGYSWIQLTLLRIPADDRFETRYYMPHLSGLLRLPCYVLFCWRGQLSGSLQHWALYVFVFAYCSLTHRFVVDSGVVWFRPLRIHRWDVTGLIFTLGPSTE